MNISLEKWEIIRALMISSFLILWVMFGMNYSSTKNTIIIEVIVTLSILVLYYIILRKLRQKETEEEKKEREEKEKQKKEEEKEKKKREQKKKEEEKRKQKKNNKKEENNDNDNDNDNENDSGEEISGNEEYQPNLEMLKFEMQDNYAQLIRNTCDTDQNICEKCVSETEEYPTACLFQGYEANELLDQIYPVETRKFLKEKCEPEVANKENDKIPIIKMPWLCNKIESILKDVSENMDTRAILKDHLN